MSEVYRDRNASAERRAADLLGRMTMDEKIAQLGSTWVYELLSDGRLDEAKAGQRMPEGIGQITRIGGASDAAPGRYVHLANAIQRYLTEQTRLGIPAIVHEECCSGFMTRGASLFPQTIGLAASWEPDLIERIGAAIRRQMKRVGAHHALAPVLDVTRDARWGRVEETFGEDPYLVARMGGSYIEGLQGNETEGLLLATAKHFVGYGMSEGGMNWAPSHIPERELREVYMFPFEAAVRACGLESIMNSYGEIDGIPCGASRHLLTEVLREEWGFEGLVVSDYFAINMLGEYHHIAASKKEAATYAMKAGMDVELPSSDCYGDPLRQALEEGDITADEVNAACLRVLRTKVRLGLFEHPYVEDGAAEIVLDTQADRTLALEAARKSVVLLKNEVPRGSDRPLLPLSSDGSGRIAVVGPNAASWRNMIGDYAYPCHIETLGNLGNVTNDMNTAQPEETVELHEDFASLVTVLDGIKSHVGTSVEITYAEGCDVIGGDESGHAEAVERASDADVIVAVMGDRSGLVEGCTSGEARDRADIVLPGTQRELLKKLSKLNKPVVLVLLNARPVDLSWEHEHLDAIMAAWLPGEEGGNALAQVLFGEASPGGKLPMSFPRHIGQTPVFHGHKPSGGRSHWMGRYVEVGTDPLYPFGYGLGYTTFELADASLETETVSAGDSLRVRCRIENVGEFHGDEVLQLYTHGPRNIVTRPVRELRGFRRVSLAPGEAADVVFEVPWESFGFYDETMRYRVHPGKIDVMVGRAADSVLWSAKVQLEAAAGGTDVAVADKRYFSASSVQPSVLRSSSA